MTDTEKMKYGRRYMALAWGIEIVAIATGLGIAVAQAATGNGDWRVWAPVFGIFAMMAAAEAGKIPLATAAFHARGLVRGGFAAALVVVSLISFETMFNGFERWAHNTTTPVHEAARQVEDLRGTIAQLASVASVEVDGPTASDMDTERRALLRETVDRATEALAAAERASDDPETRQAREGLTAAQAAAEAAGAAAAGAWQSEQDSITARLRADAAGELDLGARLRAQLQNRMADMPAKQTVIANARAPYDAEAERLLTQLRAAEAERTPEQLARIAAVVGRLDEAQAALAGFEADASQRHDDALGRRLTAEAAGRARDERREALEVDLVAAERTHRDAAEASQMHRWASFAFGAAPAEVSEEQVKRTSAVMGAFLGMAVALAGSIIALVACWFRVNGIPPREVERVVEVEKLVEVEKIVEVEKPVDRYIAVPVATTREGREIVDDVLARLPSGVQSEIRRQLTSIEGGLRHAA